MRTSSLVVLVLLGAGLVAGCSTSPTCDDVTDLTSQLNATSRDDSAYYDIADKLNQAQADCNAR